MNDLEILRELGRSLDETPLGDGVRGVLERELAAARPARRRWPVALPVAGAALLVAAVLLLVTVVTPHRGAVPQPSPAPAATFTRPSPAEKDALDGPEVLRTAAEAARARTGEVPGASAFRYIREMLTSSSSTGGWSDPADVQTRHRSRETWASVDGTRDGLTRSTDMEGPANLPGCVAGATTCDPAYRKGVPSDAAGALTFLRSLPVPESERTTPDGDAFAVSSTMLLDHDLSPASRAAILEALAGIPGVHRDQGVYTPADQLTAPSAFEVSLEGEFRRDSLLIDRDTFEVVGARWRSVEAGARDHPSTIWLQTSGYVDQVGERP